MLIRLLLAGAVALSAPAAAEPSEKPSEKYSQKVKRVKTRCIGDRCAIYVNGYRTGSYKEEHGRVIVRDKRGRRIAVLEEDD